MKKRGYVYGALTALMTAAVLLTFSCKQPEQGGQGGSQGQSQGGSGQTNPGGNQSKPRDNDNKGTQQVFTNALQFEGTIGPSDSQEADKLIKSDYLVSVTISHNRVGVSAEEKSTGFLFMGSAPYDEKTGSVDVVLANVKDAEKTLSFGATYQSVTKILKVTEFGGEERSAILPLKTEKTVDQRVQTYTVPATLPVLGESVVVFKISGNQATVAVVSGRGSAPGRMQGSLGSYETLGAYTAETFVVRGALSAKIPLDDVKIDKAKTVLEIKATVTASGVQDVKSSILSLKEKDGAFDSHDSDHLKATTLPHFKPARFTFKGNTGAANADVYFGLHLEAMPAVRRQVVRGKIEVRETYEMKAQFFKYTGGTPGEPSTALTDQSKEVRVLATLESGTYGSEKDPPVFSFTFPAGCFVYTAVDRLANKGDADAVGFTITNWRPLAGWHETEKDDDGYAKQIPETVVSGDYVLKVDTATGVLTPDGSGGVKAVVLGQKSVSGMNARGGIDGLSKDGYKDTNGLNCTALIAGKKANELFALSEGFKRR